MKRLAIILAFLLAVVMPVAALAQEPSEGTVEGQVINGTEGGGSVEGVEVTLLIYIDNVLAGTINARTDGEGKFQFNNVDIRNEYLVSARYMEVDYYYPVVFEPGEMTAYVEVGVCDTTASDELIRTGLSHTIIEVGEESLCVTEVLWQLNDGDRTYVGTEGVLVFNLPEGAFGFNAPKELMPDFQLLEGNRVTYLVPFPPGDRQLVYTYGLARPDSGDLIIPLEISYPTDIFELMVSSDDIEVAVTRLAPAEPVFTESGERFIHFQGVDLPRGTDINISISGLSEGGGQYFVILWVIIAVVIAGIVIYILKKVRREKANE